MSRRSAAISRSSLAEPQRDHQSSSSPRCRALGRQPRQGITRHGHRPQVRADHPSRRRLPLRDARLLGRPPRRCRRGFRLGWPAARSDRAVQPRPLRPAADRPLVGRAGRAGRAARQAQLRRARHLGPPRRNPRAHGAGHPARGLGRVRAARGRAAAGRPRQALQAPETGRMQPRDDPGQPECGGGRAEASTFPTTR